jgi:hypothetical protein
MGLIITLHVQLHNLGNGKSFKIVNCEKNSGIDLLENQVKEAKQMVEESDIKYDEVARKLAMVRSQSDVALSGFEKHLCVIFAPV